MCLALMTKSTRRRTKCASCGNDYNAKGDNTRCPYCSGAKTPPGTKPNRKGFHNHGGSPKGTLGDKFIAQFEKGKGR